MTTYRKKLRRSIEELRVPEKLVFNKSELPDKELLRAAYEEGREWAWYQHHGAAYAVPPLSFEAWWVARFGKEEE